MKNLLIVFAFVALASSSTFLPRPLGDCQADIPDIVNDVVKIYNDIKAK